MRQYQSLVGLTPDGVVGEATWNSIYRSYSKASFALQRDTVRGQAPGGGEIARVGQYPGYELTQGQQDQRGEGQG